MKFDPERVKFEDENITFFSARNGKASPDIKDVSPDIKDVSDKYVSPLFRSYGLLSSLVVRKYMDVNDQERLSNITLRHKLK